jgi:hypothetical protein
MHKKEDQNRLDEMSAQEKLDRTTRENLALR